MTERIYLEKIEPARNRMRFYAVAVTSDLLGNWALVREWGHVGRVRTVRTDRFESEETAIEYALALMARKAQRGYRVV